MKLRLQKIKVLVYFFAIAQILVSCTSYLVGVKNSKTKDFDWSGKYRQVNGMYELYIEQWELEAVFAEIVQSGKDPGNRYEAIAFFVAAIKGMTAEWSSGSECTMVLEKVNGGIIVQDFCKGPGNNSGFYKRLN